jgi:predicted nucleotidyltransferase
MTTDAKAVDDALDIAAAAAAQTQLIRAVALVGSRAAGRARPDSDIDLVFLVSEKQSFSEGDAWQQLVPAGGQLIRSKEWGVVTERRVRFASGLELELNFAPVSWASTQPLDPGTHRVVQGGMRPLYDPDRLLVALADAVAQA